jgi:hypothetical protein
MFLILLLEKLLYFETSPPKKTSILLNTSSDSPLINSVSGSYRRKILP